MLILNLVFTKPQDGLFSSDLSSFLAGFFSSGETIGQDTFSPLEVTRDEEEGVYVTDEGGVEIDVPEGIGSGGF